MDPDEALRRIRAAIVHARAEEYRGANYGAHVEELMELVSALDEWLTRGGFKPKDWK
jgi:hypothetical protein